MTYHASPHPRELALYGTGGPDLWCTYAALRTLQWLNIPVDDPFSKQTHVYLSARRNGDGGYGWNRGMQSDAWATFYATQAIADLGGTVPNVSQTTEWLRRTWTGEAYAMLPGQAPDAWATHFSVRTSIAICHEVPHDPQRLLGWLSGLQTEEGGLSWSPAHALAGQADARACFYGVMAWKALSTCVVVAPPWDVTRLSRWLHKQQQESGGYLFNERAAIPCMWATYRATASLAALGEVPAKPALTVSWILRQRGVNGSFVRWPGYDVEDVWAAFCGIGALRALNAHVQAAEIKPFIAQALSTMRCASGGYTYRQSDHSADVLSVAAHVLAAGCDEPTLPLVEWIESCQLPNEAGIMYMPGRGAEVRCTLWALAAGAFRRSALPQQTRKVRELVDWLTKLQNPDGGYGYWEGRGSDMVSTAAAVEAFSLVGMRPPDESVIEFVNSCEQTDEAASRVYANVPGGEPSLRAGLQAYRIRHRLTGTAEQDGLKHLLQKHQTRGGGYANIGARLPDLLTTYEAVVTADRLGLDIDTAPLRVFADRITSSEGTAWTPLAPHSADALANCLGSLLLRRLRGGVQPLPALCL